MDGTAHLVRRVAGGVARGLAAALSLALLAGSGYGWSVQRELTDNVVTSDVIDTPEPTEPEAPDRPFTALLVGLDSRTDAAGNPLPPDLLARLRAGVDEGQLHTDTMIVLHVPAGRNARAVAISIPRDSYVVLAGGRARHKINSAYGRATARAEDDLAEQGVTGPDLDRRARDAGRRALVATVQQFTGEQIDHYAEINLAGFVEMTDAIGGVPVCLRNPVAEPRSGVDLPAGYQTVQGADARAVVPPPPPPTTWRAVTWTGSPASRRSSPGWRAGCCRRGRSRTPWPWAASSTPSPGTWCWTAGGSSTG